VLDDVHVGAGLELVGVRVGCGEWDVLRWLDEGDGFGAEW
jgi:hypothetical protein